MSDLVSIITGEDDRIWDMIDNDLEILDHSDVQNTNMFELQK